MMTFIVWWTGKGWLTTALCLLTMHLDISTADIPGQRQIKADPNPSLHGQHLSLSCLPGPLPSDEGKTDTFYNLDRFIWQNNSQRLAGEGSMTIHIQADFSYPGQFTCQKHKSDPVTLPFTPSVSHLLITMQSSAAVEDGQRMTLTCLCSEKLLLSRLKFRDWCQNNHPIEDTASKELTLVANVSDPSFYDCSVVSHGVTFISPTFHPNIFPQKPTIRQSGHKLVCDTPSDVFLPQVRWFKNGVMFAIEDGLTINLKKLGVSRFTRFKCQVKEQWRTVYSKLSHEFVLIDTNFISLHQDDDAEEPHSSLTSGSSSRVKCKDKSSFKISSSFIRSIGSRRSGFKSGFLRFLLF